MKPFNQPLGVTVWFNHSFIKSGKRPINYREQEKYRYHKLPSQLARKG
jgi:hypothetical protein